MKITELINYINTKKMYYKFLKLFVNMGKLTQNSTNILFITGIGTLSATLTLVPWFHDIPCLMWEQKHVCTGLTDWFSFWNTVCLSTLTSCD